MGARFAQMARVIALGDGIPAGLHRGQRAGLARYAACAGRRLVPGVEPEVLMAGIIHSSAPRVTEEVLLRASLRSDPTGDA